MHSSEKILVGLARLARSAPDDPPPVQLPPALPTRVLAQLRAARPEAASPWEWLSVRAVPLAAAAAALCVYVGGSLSRSAQPDPQWLAESIIQRQLEP